MRARSLFTLLSALLFASVVCLATPLLDYGHSRYGSTLEDLKRFTRTDGTGGDTVLELWSELPLKVSVPLFTHEHFGSQIEYASVFWRAVESLEESVSALLGEEVDLFTERTYGTAQLEVVVDSSLTWGQFEQHDYGRSGAPRRAKLHVRNYTAADTTDLASEIEHALIWILIGCDDRPWPNPTRRFRTQSSDLSNMDLVEQAPSQADYEMLALALSLGDGSDLSELDEVGNVAPRVLVEMPKGTVHPWDIIRVDGSGTHDPDGDDLTLTLRQIQGFSEAAIAAQPNGLFFVQLGASGDFVFELTATDSLGNHASTRLHIYALASCPEPQALEVTDDLLVGTHYLCTWDLEGNGTRSYDHTFGTPLYHPLLGNYASGDPLVADWHIKMAVENGVNLFIIPDTRPAHPDASTANFFSGLLESMYLEKIRFCMELNLASWWETQGPYWGIRLDDVIEETISYYCRHIFDHPSYLWIDGRPVLFVYREQAHLSVSGKAARDAFIEAIREAARQRGYDLYLVGDVLGDNYNASWIDDVTEPFDSVSAYWTTGINWSFANGSAFVDVDFTENSDSVIDQFELYTEHLRGTGKVLAPAISCGFDNSPAFDIGRDNWLWRQTRATKEEFRDLVEKTIPFVDDATPLLVVYAWNEIVEGGVLEPTHEMGYAYLEALRDVVAVQPANGWPENSLTLAGEPGVVLERGATSCVLSGSASELAAGTSEESEGESQASRVPLTKEGSPCRPIPFSDIFWLASYDDESGQSEANFADIVQGNDEHGYFYAMEWSSPEDTDLTIGDLDQQDLASVVRIELELSSREPVSVLPVIQVQDGNYCGRSWRYATTETIEVGPAPQDYQFSVSDFSDDPFGGCPGPLEDDAFERIYSIVLFPEDREGELRVYGVRFCKDEPVQASVESQTQSDTEDAAQAPAEPESVEEAPAVEEVSGCECSGSSSEITLVPDRSSIKPGESVNWTVCANGIDLPATIHPDFNNDGIYEEAIVLESESTCFAIQYIESNIYVPYLVYVDSESGTERIFHSPTVIGVLPELGNRQGIGLRLPSPASPTGDYIKGMHVFTLDQSLFESSSGREYVRDDLERIAGLGTNLVVFNCIWFVRDVLSANIEPHYGDVWPWHWQNTLRVDNLIDLVDWAHELGMRAGFRFLNNPAGNYDGTGNFDRDPADRVLHESLQSQKHTFYARLAAMLDLEFYDLGGEDNLMTVSGFGKTIAEAVSSEFDGVITISPTSTEGALYRCPFMEDLDLLGHTEYLLHGFTENGVNEFDNVLAAATAHFSNGLEPFLRSEGKVGILAEQGASVRDFGAHRAAELSENILETLAVLADSGSPVIGTIWWIWNIRREGNFEPHAVRGTAVEAVLREYYGTRLPDSISVSFDDASLVSRACTQPVATFDGALPELELWEYGGSTSATRSSLVHETGSSSLLLAHMPDQEDVDVRYGFAWHTYVRPQNWSSYDGVRLSLRSPNLNWGAEFNVVDEDGDRFNTRIYATPWFDDWVRVDIPFEALINPAWAKNPAADGQLNLRRVLQWGIGIVYSEHGPQSLYVDDICLYRE